MDVPPNSMAQAIEFVSASKTALLLALLIKSKDGLDQGCQCNAADWHVHGDARLMDRRYGILRDNLADPPAATAGEYLYSNLAFVIAGAMAEKVTGKTWEALMQERLFEPLGMSSAGFGPPGAPGGVDQP